VFSSLLRVVSSCLVDISSRFSTFMSTLSTGRVLLCLVVGSVDFLGLSMLSISSLESQILPSDLTEDSLPLSIYLSTVRIETFSRREAVFLSMLYVVMLTMVWL
jgi:hypothetical protein